MVLSDVLLKDRNFRVLSVGVQDRVSVGTVDGANGGYDAGREKKNTRYNTQLIKKVVWRIRLTRQLGANIRFLLSDAELV